MTSLPPAPAPWRPLLRLVAWLADLRLAIVLLLLIATASGLGTAIPQKEAAAFYHQRYDDAPWLGWLKADGLLRLQLDHVYSSGWFLALLALLGLALLLCSWRRQWPALQASLRWTDYTTPRQLSKLTLAETFPAPQDDALKMLADQLRAKGWSVREREGRFAARKGVVGRVGPLLVHAGMVVLMVGAAWGALAGQRLERFLAPGSDLQLLDRQGRPQVTVALDRFSIARDPAGRPEQFTSSLRLIPPAAAESAPRTTDDPLPAATTRPPLSPATPLAASAAASAAVNPTAPASAITDLPGSAHPAPAAVDSAAAAVPAPSSAVAEPAADPLSALVFPGVADPPPSAADSVPAAASTPALVRSGPASRAMPPPLPAPPPPPPPPTLPARNPVRQAEISVNHPLRYKGITLYQADWTLASIQIQLGRSPVLELPLQRFPQLGEEVWGLLLPTRPDGSQLVLLTLSSEEGPVEVFGADGASLGVLRPGGDPLDVRGLPVRVVGVVPASGVLFKRDPGVPLVYSGFAIVLLGGALSLVATRQLWVVEERREDGPWVHAAGLCNRNLTAFARELPSLLEGIASPLRG
jgi:cytochrome c biogenesis protein ResB